MNLTGKCIFITGAGSGLGAATAQTVVEAGGTVVLGDINEEAGNATAAGLGPSAHFAPTDVTDEASVRAALDAGVQRFGRLDGVVNCAGIVLGRKTLGSRGPHDLESFARVVQVNLIGTFNVVRLASEHIARTEAGEGDERGVIVNTASVAAFDGQIGQAAYAASKGGIAAMTLPLAREFARMGVRVMSIAPGTFDTPLLAGLPEAARQSLAQQVPFPPRLGRPEEYAALVRHIFENEMLNGEAIRLDGAIRMAPK
jgi:NAD(P)-dependent dehydrogenase (short-subunit alcohol dehydrogenase family)